MIAKLTIHPDQIRWYVESALSGFETLDHDDAVENALHDLRAIKAYLDLFDATEKAALVSGVSGIKAGVDLELRVCERDAGHLSDL